MERTEESSAKRACPMPAFSAIPQVTPLASKAMGKKGTASKESSAAESGKNEAAEINTRHAPTFKVVPRVTPLAIPEAKAKPRPSVRAENEDDDGYDPYSDFHDAPQKQPLFEASPWD